MVLNRGFAFSCEALIVCTLFFAKFSILISGGTFFDVSFVTTLCKVEAFRSFVSVLMNLGFPEGIVLRHYNLCQIWPGYGDISLISLICLNH